MVLEGLPVSYCQDLRRSHSAFARLDRAHTHGGVDVHVDSEAKVIAEVQPQVAINRRGVVDQSRPKEGIVMSIRRLWRQVIGMFLVATWVLVCLYLWWVVAGAYGSGWIARECPAAASVIRNTQSAIHPWIWRQYIFAVQ